MSLTAIINLAERLLNNSSQQSADSGSTSKQPRQTARVPSDPRGGDQFTPSSAAPQDAGLFQVRNFSLFSAAADFLLTQTQANALANPAGAPENGAAAPAPPEAVTVNPHLAPQIVAAASQQVPVANPTPAANAPVTPPAGISVLPVATTSSSAGNLQSQLLALNSALSALGLNASQLAQVDRIASFIQDFNPLAFTSLVYQLEALAQANSQQAAAPATSTATSTPSANGNGNGGFQIQELAITFSGAQESITQSAPTSQGGNSTLQLSAFNLQVQEVNLTLANPAGQQLQVTAPQTPAAVPATSLVKTAAA